MLSKSCEYGIRAIMRMALVSNGDFVSIRAISEDLDISFHFLTKIFQKLTQAGILESYRGPKGGIRLAKPATQITLKDLIVALDGDGLFTTCILGLPGCGNDKPCPLHSQWGPQRTQLDALFSRTTLHDMVHDLESFDYRLTALGGN